MRSRVAGAARRVLAHEADVGRGECGLDGPRTVPGDHRDGARTEVANGGEDVGGERTARERVEDLGQRRVHALAVTGGEDCDVGGGHQAREARVGNDDTPALGAPGRGRVSAWERGAGVSSG